MHKAPGQGAPERFYLGWWPGAYSFAPGRPSLLLVFSFCPGAYFFASPGFVAFCPFASWQPCEIWLLPAAHAASFETSSTDELQRLADVLHVLIQRIESLIPGVAYNLVLNTAPWSGSGKTWNHWRIELLPRLNAFAGLELATGIYVNPVAPERAAGRLRLG